ncbi:MAG: TerC family protein [Gemmataceae bacterium]|nr:TerC family protein [Gemmata sp.]MDW8199532.1 TerC family protein [Gemmataceae bacterium]
MSERLRSWWFLALGLAVLLLAVWRPVIAQPTPSAGPDDRDPAYFPQVIVVPAAGGASIEGRWQQSTVTLQTDYGSTTIRLQHVKRITFQMNPEGESYDTVQLVDKTILRGRVVADTFLIELKAAHQPLPMTRAEIREIRVVNPASWSLVAVVLGLVTLAAMEIVLGVDNIIFLAIIASRLPPEQQPKARKIGLGAALGTRLALLGSLWLLLGLTAPLFTLPDLGVLRDMEAREVSLRDLILLAGGLFLIGKSTFEIHKKLEEARAAAHGDASATPRPASFAWTIVTIAIIDIVFSLDSVITAIGMVEQIWVMVVAMVIAMVVMLYFAGPIAEFVERHPTIKVLALSFLILIGVMLVAEGLGQHIDKGYIYTAMSFSLIVELINMRLRRAKTATPADEKSSGGL